MAEEYIVQVLDNDECINNGMLVRCRDCKRWDRKDDLTLTDDFREIHNCNMVDLITFENEYCCWAERRMTTVEE